MRFKDVDKFEVDCSEEDNFGRSGMKVSMNDVKFVVRIRFEVE